MLSFDFSKFHVGIFDSGLGGKHVSLQIEQQFPQIRVTSLADQKNIPYGGKTPQEMFECIKPFMEQFETLGVDLIILACNTCFLNLGPQLHQLTKIPIIGYEPALALAAKKTVSQSVFVCATPAALTSQRWLDIKAQFKDLKITEFDCADWVSLIETSKFTPQHLQVTINQVLAVEADSLVLGCTHYHWLRPALQALIPVGYQLDFYEPTAIVLEEMADFFKKDI